MGYDASYPKMPKDKKGKIGSHFHGNDRSRVQETIKI